MDGMTEPKWVKAPDGHLWLQLSLSIRFDDRFNGDANRGELGDGANVAIDKSTVGMSDELCNFLDGCVGNYHIDKQRIMIGFDLNEDFVRYKLVNFPDLGYA